MDRGKKVCPKKPPPPPEDGDIKEIAIHKVKGTPGRKLTYQFLRNGNFYFILTFSVHYVTWPPPVKTISFWKPTLQSLMLRLHFMLPSRARDLFAFSFTNLYWQLELLDYLVKRESEKLIIDFVSTPMFCSRLSPSVCVCVYRSEHVESQYFQDFLSLPLHLWW